MENSIFSTKKEFDDTNSNTGHNDLTLIFRRNPEAKKLFQRRYENLTKPIL